MAARPDPWLTDRLRADIVLTAAEKRIEDALLLAMSAWLEEVRALVLRGWAGLDNRADIIAAGIKGPASLQVSDRTRSSNQALASATRGARRRWYNPRSEGTYNISALVADADFVLDLDAVQGAFGQWQEALQNHVEPAISDAFGDGFGGALRTAQISPKPYQEAHIRDVHDRLKIWPDSAWEDMRPELQQIVARGGTIEEAAEQVAGILDINAPTRKLRERIAAVDAQIAESTDKATIRGLRAQRRALWEEHDRSLGEWQWKARRIARTEVQGAIEGGALAGAEATQQATGVPMFKQWLATHDARCRRSHAIADGQIVPLKERFTVGRAHLKHPAQPSGPAHEVIHCRCTLKILDQNEVDEALASDWGRRGVQPMSARLGPDDQSQIDLADDLLLRERNGEVVKWPDKEAPPPPPKKRKPRPGEEFKGMSLDELGQATADAIEREDWDYIDRVVAEEARRTAANAAGRARREAAREAKQAAQSRRYDELLEQGVDDETAVSEAFGISIDQQRRMNAISHLRGLGYQGRGLDDLVKAWARDEQYQAWRVAEDELNGQLLKPKYREAGNVDPAGLWTMPESTAMRYASDELKAWWDTHGRVTAAELKAQLLDPAELVRIMSGRKDYLQ